MLKKQLIWWLIVLILGAITFWLIADPQGYVILVRPPYRIQFSFNFLLVFILFGLFAFYYALVLLQFLKRMPAKRRNDQEIKQLRNSQSSLIASITAMANDDFEGAEKAALNAKKLQNDASLDQMIALINDKKNNQTQSEG